MRRLPGGLALSCPLGSRLLCSRLPGGLTLGPAFCGALGGFLLCSSLLGGSTLYGCLLLRRLFGGLPLRGTLCSRLVCSRLLCSRLPGSLALDHALRGGSAFGGELGPSVGRGGILLGLRVWLRLDIRNLLGRGLRCFLGDLLGSLSGEPGLPLLLLVLDRPAKVGVQRVQVGLGLGLSLGSMLLVR